jgi:hypothetical protein
MALDGVPWAIGDAAEMSTEVLRTLAYAATAGSEGVLATGDLKITALPAPAGAVRWAPGVAVIRNRSIVNSQQSYVARNPFGTAEITNAIAATGSGAGRSDLIVLRVEDGQYDPWQKYTNPTQIQFGPYVFPRVISGVPNTTTRADQLGLPHSMLALARIDIPANTTAITNQMIADLRQVVVPRRQRRLFRVDMDASSGVREATSTSWTNWPGTAAAFDVPYWAGEMIVRINIDGIAVTGGSFGGAIRSIFSLFNGPELGSTKLSPVIELNFDDGNRHSYEIADQIVIPASARGTTQYIYPQAARFVGVGGVGRLRAGDGTSVVYDIEMIETPN